MNADLLNRRVAAFTLWAPGQVSPALVIGTFQYGAPPVATGLKPLPLKPVAGLTDLWQVAAADCGLTDGAVYHYWFEVDDTRPGSAAGTRVRVTDPLASTVDWRLQEADGEQPASVIKFQNGKLIACDQDGTSITPPAVDNPAKLPTNNFTIIYELPTAWLRKPRGGAELGIGTFRDVIALLDPKALSPNFDQLAAVELGHAYMAELGINALELLPPADSYLSRQWGYGTSHMFAPDTELGQPEFHSWSTANADLRRLAETCHGLGIRLIADVVMAFERDGPYERIAFNNFHIASPTDSHPADPHDPDAWNSRPEHGARFGFGSTLWRYVRQSNTYDPISGQNATFVPARNLHYAAQERWMTDFHIDGYRIDSVENVANWDFLEGFTDNARNLLRARCAAHGLSNTDADARLLVVGEELNDPIEIIQQGRITALWNDHFREYVRAALAGKNAPGESTFEWTVKKMVDCTLFGFSDLAQAVNYIGSHDVEGAGHERIATTFRYQFPNDDEQVGRRLKLAFACLLTAVGIPMILAGDEFADENDLFNIRGSVTNDAGKQINPVDFERATDPWRQSVLAVVKNLIKLRKTHPALGVNDTKWLHMDFTPGRRVMVWRRGSDDNPVVVIANFSDFQSDANAEYVVPNWPRPNDFAWTEVTLNRNVSPGWIGRESLFPWEAKVYVHQ